MPEPGERKILNDKEFEWVESKTGGGFWSQCNVRAAEGSSAWIADCCAKIRNKSRDNSSLLINFDLFIYKKFNFCKACLDYIQEYPKKFPKEYKKIKKLKNPNQNDQEK